MSNIAGDIRPGFLNMPKLPVAGFFLRVFAMMIDLILLITGIHLAQSTLPDLFWALGRWSPYLTGGFVFVYFVFFNSKHGRGRTVGKLLIGIATTDYDGNPPTLRQAVIRTCVLFPIFVTSPIMESIIGRPDTIAENFWKGAIVAAPFIAILVATAISIPFNPFKQGLHDFLAQTLVRPAARADQPALEYPTFEAMAEGVGTSWVKFHRQPQYSSGVAFLLVWGLLVFMLRPSGYPEFYALMLRKVSTLETTTAPAGAELSWRFLPSTSPSWPGLLAEMEKYPEIASALEATTGTTTLVITASHEGNWPDTPFDADSILDAYYAEILPLYMNFMSNEDNSNAIVQMGLDPAVPELLSKEPFNLALLRASYVALTPYPAALNRFTEIRVKEYSPINSQRKNPED